ncbi:hypothetical protein [Chlorobaculum sp. 24CR]|uniref:hypothetical protein n=1 Tax=Chlorobaculum sp. 24CR TaxID=2508878 RepID=UPI001431FCE8|nr:hypothetical protein [Chlorobaculum sp. 24CR]
MDERLFIAPIKAPRESWKEQYEKGDGTGQALSEEEQEWIDASLVDENIVDCVH